jgi:hypothetical protein
MLMIDFVKFAKTSGIATCFHLSNKVMTLLCVFEQNSAIFTDVSLNKETMKNSTFYEQSLS